MSKHLDGYRWMIRGESGAIKADPVRCFLEKYGPPCDPRGGAKKSTRFAQHLRGGGENTRRAGLQFSLDQWQEAVADAIAQKALVLVRGVLAEAPTRALGQVPEIGARHSQKGAEPGRARLVHGGEAAEARASEQVQQYRLRLVVPGMAENDPGRAAATGQAAQAGSADASRKLFRRRAARPGRGGARSQAEKRQSKGLRQVPHPRCVAAGALAERVIDVSHHDPPAADRCFGQAKAEQSRGIGTTRDRD